MRKIFRSPRYQLPILSLFIVGVLFIVAACGGTSNTTSASNSNNTNPTATTAPTTPATPTSGTTPTGSKQTVTITTNSSGTFAFSPALLTIPVGTTVVWKNMTGAPHTATSDDGSSFDSGTANPIAAQGGTYQFTFTKAGTFTYHCSIHPFMKATILVK